MFQRLSNTWQLMKASWYILKQDKEMLIFPLVSGICCLMVLASFAIPIIQSDSYDPPGKDATADQYIAYYGVLFLFYFCNYFIIVFFNSAVIACAVKRMQGDDPTVGDGFSAAFSRLPAIAGWAVVAATVGLILRIIEDRSEKIGRIVAGILGMAWTLTSFLVVPSLVINKSGPIEAYKDSIKKLKQTWGEQIVGNFGFGLIFFVLGIPAFIVAALGFLSGPGTVMVACFVVAFIYLIVLALIQSALQAIFQAALYLYADTQKPPSGFDASLMSNSIAAR